MIFIKLTKRQEEIIEIVKRNQPITSEQIAEKLNLTRAALRPDLAILTMTGILEARPKVGYVYSQKGEIAFKHKPLKDITVADIKSKPTVVSEDMSIYDSIIQLFINDTGTLFVENKGYLTGAVSRKDFLKITLGNTDIHKVPIGIIMTRMPNIVTITDNESAYEAARRIIEHEIDSLPVVEKIKTEDGKELLKITGKVSKTTITRLFVELANE